MAGMDIAISAVLAVVTIVMAYLGVHVTLHPTESPRARRLYKTGFWGCALVAVSLVIWQGIRSNKAQAGFRSDVQEARNASIGLARELGGVQGQVTQLLQEQQVEVAKREQTQRDLITVVQATSQATRRQVLANMKSLSSTVEAGKSALQKMSNKELRQKIKDYGDRILQFNSDHTISEEQTEMNYYNQEAEAIRAQDRSKADSLQQQHIQWEIQNGHQFEVSFQEQFLVEGQAYREELINRLGPQPLNQPQHIMPSALDGHIDMWSITATADYLEWVASKLPDSD
jgi:hypothetical protein